MSAFRVVQISDTHLSAELPFFVPNFDAMAGIVAARRPDLVVNTGDVALDGAKRDDDLAFARRCHDRLGTRWVAIPGNHDLGDNPWRPDLAEPITEERLARYRRHFGDDFWRIDACEWVLIGVNAQLFGSGLPAEDEQWDFLASAAKRTGGRPVGLFVHKPLFKDDPDETSIEGRYVPPASRRRLATALGEVDVRLVASGHLHQHRQLRTGRAVHVWAPSTAYILPDRRQPSIGVKRVGYVAYTFNGGSVDVEIVEPGELTNHDRDEFPTLYR